MTPRLRIRPGARAEIRAARRWYEGESRGLGGPFWPRSTPRSRSRHPEMYEALEDEEPAVRRALLHRFPYALVSEVVPPAAAREVVVLACFHLRQGGPPDWRSRR